jgi:hypothetical protein
VLSAMLTSAAGCDVSTTVNVAGATGLGRGQARVGVTVMPEASLSVLVTATSFALNPL